MDALYNLIELAEKQRINLLRPQGQYDRLLTEEYQQATDPMTIIAMGRNLQTMAKVLQTFANQER